MPAARNCVAAKISQSMCDSPFTAVEVCKRRQKRATLDANPHSALRPRRMRPLRCVIPAASKKSSAVGAKAAPSPDYARSKGAPRGSPSERATAARLVRPPAHALAFA
eukprot:6172260-Pleurochrysis_carterae.AAC.1